MMFPSYHYHSNPQNLGESSCGHHLSAQSHAVVAKLTAEDGLQQLRRKEFVHDLLDLGAELSARGHGFILETHPYCLVGMG